MLFKNLQTSLYQIKGLIKSNTNIGKLLYYSTADALSKTDISPIVINDFIYLSPVFDTTLEPYDKVNFISINLASIDASQDDTLFDGILRINIMSQNVIWEINENKIRPIEIMDEIHTLLQNTKFDISHKLNFLESELVVLDKNISGYIMLFAIIEGSGLQDDF